MAASSQASSYLASWRETALALSNGRDSEPSVVERLIENLCALPYPIKGLEEKVRKSSKNDGGPMHLIKNLPDVRASGHLSIYVHMLSIGHHRSSLPITECRARYNVRTSRGFQSTPDYSNAVSRGVCRLYYHAWSFLSFPPLKCCQIHAIRARPRFHKTYLRKY